MELYLRVRRACMVDGMSTKEASRVFGLHRDTVRKMIAYSAPPGYRRRQPPGRPKIGPYTGVIDRILEDDPVSRTGQALGPSQEAAPHCQAHLRPTQGRVRLRRQVHDRQGLRQRASHRYT